MKIKPVVLSLALIAVVGLVAAVVMRRPITQTATVTSPLVDQASLKTLPVKDASSADVSRIGPFILPPTNSWLSGMVLQKNPLPVYPMPLSFLAKNTGFEIGLPAVASTPTVISGGHVPGIVASVEQAQNFVLSRYDKISATLTYADSQNKTLGLVTLAEGSPYVFYEATNDSHLSLVGVDSIATSTDDASRYLRYTKDGHDYVVAVSGDGMVAQHGDTASLSLKKGSFATFYALPDAGPDKLRSYAGNRLKSVKSSYVIHAQSVDTTLTYTTANQRPTVFAAPGYQSVEKPGPTLAIYDNIYGPMTTMSGTALTTTVPRVAPSNQLDISHLTDAHKQSVIASLKQDAANTKITATDSYFAGKQLARLANLLDVAQQLKQADVANSLRSNLKSELTKRLNGSYFYYDGRLHGVAATTHAFGSEDFNDHHFHYGYFIYAASILGKYDPQFMADYEKKVNLLVADIASYDATNDFPIRRNYDPYAGHSWAAGLAPFADGNNQESSSEAINAWNAVTLWGQITHDNKLADSGIWMLANESLSGQRAWRSTPAKTSTTSQFASPLTSLNFSGKRTYATFFSDEPSEKLGIQLIPMNPSMVSFASDGDAIDQQLKTATTNDNYNVPLGDYELMYLALRNPSKAVKLAQSQQDTFIDDGNSRTYLNAWLFSQSDR